MDAPIIADAWPESAPALERLERLEQLARHAWPRRCFQAIVDGLRDGPGRARDIALRLAGRTVYDSVAAALLELLDDADPDVRHRALLAVRGMVGRAAAFDFDVPCNPSAATKERFEEILRAVRRLFHDPDAAPELRRGALVIGAQAGQGWAAGGARVAMSGDDLAWRVAGLEAARFVDDLGGGAERALDAADDAVLEAAVRAVAAHRRTSAAPRLLEIAGMGAGNARLAAIEALGRMGVAGAAGLLERLATHDDGAVSAAAGEALRWLALDVD